MSGGVDWLMVEEIKQAIKDGVINEQYNDFDTPSIAQLKDRMSALGEIDIYVVIRSLIKYHRELFVDILEYMNKKEGE